MGRSKKIGRRRMKQVLVIASWDHEAKRWWAVGAEVRGVAAEAATMRELMDNIQKAVADLFEYDPQLAAQYNSIRVVFMRDFIVPLA